MSTYTPIASITCAANTTTLVFDNIPSIYNDLVLTTSGLAQTAGGGSISLKFNNDTLASSTNYSYIYMFNSASGTSGAITNSAGILVNRHSTTTGMGVCHINDYASATKRKTVISDGGGNNIAIAIGGTWRNTEPITKITMNFESGPGFAAGFTANLYGVGTNVNANAKALGGDYITTDGTYWYHAFKTSGTFAPKQSLSCDILVVAGGGGGGGNSFADAYYVGAGGGAGGVLAYTSQTVSTATTVTVGAGGAAGVSATAGTNGGNSQFGALTASLGGGWGASVQNGGVSGTYKGATGGSGGGSMNQSGGQTGGLGTAGQGNNGGAGTYSGGGGGGAGGTGGNSTFPASNQNPGAGGAGTNSYSAYLNPVGAGVNGYIAGGGGGGFSVAYGDPTSYSNGGSGGGGVGGAANPLLTSSRAQFTGNGQANTGGGGGGGGANGNIGGATQGGSGGSGLVIVRYAV